MRWTPPSLAPVAMNSSDAVPAKAAGRLSPITLVLVAASAVAGCATEPVELPPPPPPAVPDTTVYFYPQSHHVSPDQRGPHEYGVQRVGRAADGLRPERSPHPFA